jgi:hypothetical protein
VLLERPDRGPRPHLLGQAVHDLDAREIALVNGAIVGLAGERLLMDAPVGVAVEEAAVAAFQLQHPARRFGHERPHQLLVVDPSPTRERVEKVGVDGIGRGEHGVVAALNHARAAGAPEQALDHHGDREMRRAVGGVEGRAQPGAARAQDQEVCLEDVDGALRRDYSPGPGPDATRETTVSERAPSGASR